MGKTTQLIKRYGVTGLIRKVKERSFAKEDYDWTDYAPGIEELEAERSQTFSYTPKISIVVPCYNTKESYLLDLIRSVKMQTYANWELILVDASDKPMEKLDELHNVNIIVKHLSKNLGISGNTNEGLALATGDYIGLLDHDDMLAPNALFEMVKAINMSYANDWEHLLIYSDEDKVTEDGSLHFYPHFKTDFNKELFMHYNYICHFTIFSKELLEKAGNFNLERSGSQDYDLFLRLIGAGAKVVHVPKILYHWRVTENSTSGKGDAKMYAYIAGVQSIEEYLQSRGILAMVSISEDLGVYNVTYDDYPGMAEDVESLIPYELKDVVSSVLCYMDPSVAEVKVNSYSYSDFLKKNGKRSGKNWRQLLASYLNDEEVALVCSRSVQDGKVVQCGLSEPAGEEDAEPIYQFQGLPAGFKGYMNRAGLPQDVDGFSMQSVFVARSEILQELGGIDQTLPSPQAEMDLSRRIREAGYRIVMVPQVEAVLK